jgi:hypothetical protein
VALATTSITGSLVFLAATSITGSLVFGGKKRGAKLGQDESSSSEALEQDETGFGCDRVYERMQEKRADSAWQSKKLARLNPGPQVAAGALLGGISKDGLGSKFADKTRPSVRMSERALTNC